MFGTGDAEGPLANQDVITRFHYLYAASSARSFAICSSYMSPIASSIGLV